MVMNLTVTPAVRALTLAEETVWHNPELGSSRSCELSLRDIREADARLRRFAPLIEHLFPETAVSSGIIESDISALPAMQARRFPTLTGQLLLKRDDALPIAGSVKARGGIYEVLCHTESVALKAGLLREGESTTVLAGPDARELLSGHTVQVGSTGNLGMSIGIMSAALGYHAVVHMSADAKPWKKALLRSHGVTVMEYETDYSAAVEQGRALSEADPNSYFVDDENSRALFLGYAVSALRLRNQIEALHIPVDAAHPLSVYLPCGVGGAPGGIAFGLKQVFGEHVHCWFVEPTQAPCMTLGMVTGLGSGICVRDIGLTGLTEADGLAVGRPSSFVGEIMRPLLSGCITVSDDRLFTYLRTLEETEGIFLEPSACAGFRGPEVLPGTAGGTHLVWATGGSLVPESIRESYRRRA